MLVLKSIAAGKAYREELLESFTSPENKDHVCPLSSDSSWCQLNLNRNRHHGVWSTRKLFSTKQLKCDIAQLLRQQPWDQAPVWLDNSPLLLNGPLSAHLLWPVLVDLTLAW